jgi:hypothetical protein
MHIFDNGTPKIYGDIYLMDAGEESVFGNSGTDTKLYKWTKGNITRTDAKGSFNTQYGNVFSMGSVKYDGKDQYVGGNVQVKGDLIVSCNPLTVDGDIYVDGALKVTGNLKCTGNIYAGVLNNTGSIECASISAVETPSTGNLNGKTCAKIEGASMTSSTVTKEVSYEGYKGASAPQYKLYTKAERNWYADNAFVLEARYTEHVKNTATGEEKTNDVGEDWGGYKEVIGSSGAQATYDSSFYASAYDYLMATSTLYQGL